MLETTNLRIPISLPTTTTTNNNKKKDDNNNNKFSLFAREVRHALSPSENGDIASDTVKDDKFVMILVHGGPGLNSHQESFAGLQKLLWCEGEHEYQSEEGGNGKTIQHDKGKRPFCLLDAMIFYDQLGCGQSEGPPLDNDDFDNPHDDVYSLSYYVDELQQVMRFVQNRYPTSELCLLGHSWGGQIVLEYLLTSKKGPCAATIVSNAPLVEQTYEAFQRQLRQALPRDVQQFLEQDDFVASKATTTSAAIYRKLVGTSDAHITGDLQEWNAMSRLKTLSSSVVSSLMFITGTQDTIPWQEYQEILNIEFGSVLNRTTTVKPQVHVLAGGDHAPFYGDTALAYRKLIQGFLIKLQQNQTLRFLEDLA